MPNAIAVDRRRLRRRRGTGVGNDRLKGMVPQAANAASSSAIDGKAPDPVVGASALTVISSKPGGTPVAT